MASGVWGLCCLLLLRCLVGKWAAPQGWGGETPHVADVGAGRVATVAALLCACVRRAALICFINLNARTTNPIINASVK